MKICWDNLEKIRYSKRSGKWHSFSNRKATFIYIDHCEVCSEPFLKQENSKGYCCSKSCAAKGRNNSSWKGGYDGKNLPLYNTYANQIEYAEHVRRSPDDENILEVKCAYCGKWYIPKRTDVRKRIASLNGRSLGENRFYCSNECKKECPIYYKSKYSAEETNTKQYSREVQPELRQMVFERDNYTCQKCGNTKSLHCHHVEGIRHDPLESADIDKCITYCKKCHKQVHKKEGCGTNDMQCKE